jgi:hypothetical protein
LNCVDWLTHSGRRKQVLFVEEGTIRTKFDIPLAELPPIPIPPARVINKLLNGLERENFFNSLLLELVPRSTILRILLLAASLLLLRLALARLKAACHRTPPGVPLVEATLKRTTPELPLLAQRQHVLLEEGHCLEAAQVLARHCFQHLVTNWDVRTPLPRMWVQGGWWRRRRLRKQVEELWELAQGAAHSVTRDEFAEIVLAIEEIQAALRNGSLRLEPPPAPAAAPLRPRHASPASS